MIQAKIRSSKPLLYIIVTFIYFTSCVSSVYPSVKEYEYLGNMKQLISGLKDLTLKDSNIIFNITDTVGTDDKTYGLYFNIRIKDNNRNISYELKCENNNRNISTIKFIGAHDETNKTGGYKANDSEVKGLLNYFDTQFLTELETKENIKITPIGTRASGR